MQSPLRELRSKPLTWLLIFVPIVLIAEAARPEAHTALFVLSVLAIVPLAGLLSRSTESVASKTGDAVGGLLNATLGNLTELVIAITALRAGMTDLVKASMAGAIVTNSLFLLGGSFLLGGLKNRVQDFNPRNARVQSSHAPPGDDRSGDSRGRVPHRPAQRLVRSSQPLSLASPSFSW